MNPPIKNKVARTIVSFLFIVQILFVIKFVLLRNPAELKSHFVEEYDLELLGKNISQGNYVPLSTVKYYLTGTDQLRYTKENLVGNILLFIPFGILLPLLFHSVNSFHRILLICGITSFSLELIQLFAVLGNFDIDDILLNILGACLGFGLYILVKEFTRRRQPHISE